MAVPFNGNQISYFDQGDGMKYCFPVIEEIRKDEPVHAFSRIKWVLESAESNDSFK